SWAMAKLLSIDSQLVSQLGIQATGRPFAQAFPPDVVGPAKMASARTTLENLARNLDPYVIALLTTYVGYAGTSKDQNGTAAWANGVLAAVQWGSGSQQSGTGSGVTLYADQGITISTPSTVQLTAGSSSTTVLGSVYNQTFDPGPGGIPSG